MWVNQYNLLYNNVPFGGKKQSGIGEFISHFQMRIRLYFVDIWFLQIPPLNLLADQNESSQGTWRQVAMRPAPFPSMVNNRSRLVLLPTSSDLLGLKLSADVHGFPTGRELGSYALDEYTSVKAIHWNYGEKIDWPL